jgi:hypothetical protein
LRNLARQVALRLPHVRALYDHAQHLREEREKLADTAAKSAEKARQQIESLAAERDQLRIALGGEGTDSLALELAKARTTQASLELRLAVATSDLQRATSMNDDLLVEATRNRDELTAARIAFAHVDDLKQRLEIAKADLMQLGHEVELGHLRESAMRERSVGFETEIARLQKTETLLQEAQTELAELRARAIITNAELDRLSAENKRLEQSRAELNDLRAEVAGLHAGARVEANQLSRALEALSEARSAAIQMAEKLGSAEAVKEDRDYTRRQAMVLARRLGAAESRLNEREPALDDAAPIGSPLDANRSAPPQKLLLLTDIPPCSNYTGGIAVAQQCGELSPGDLAAFVVLDPSLTPEPCPELAWIPTRVVTKPSEFWDPADRERPTAIEGESFNATVRLRDLVDQAVQYGREQGVDAVWAILEGQTVTRMAALVSEALHVPLYSQIWDPLSWWLRAHGVDRANSERTMANFDEAIRRSRSVATASWAMAEAYEERYGKRAIPVIYSQPTEVACSPPPRLRRPDQITVGLIGQFYASDAWGAFKETLRFADWKLGGRSVRFFYAGATPPSDIPAERIDCAGWLSPEQAINALSQKADVMYCPYPFASEMEEVARLSFPSKLVMFAASGRPTLCHAPSYASPTRFVRDTGMGIVADSLHGQDAVTALAALCDDSEFYAETCRSASKAFLDHFTRKHQGDKFLQFIDKLDERKK